MTANGLLYPPELWGALDHSTVAELLLRQVQDAVGAAGPRSTSATEAFAAASEEVGPLEAAFLVQDTGLVDTGDRPWSPEDVRRWWAGAVVEESVDHLWMAHQLAAGQGIALELTPAMGEMLSGAAAGVDMLPSRFAIDLLREYAPADAPGPEDSGANNLRGPRDAAWLLQLRATTSGLSPSDAGELLEAALRDSEHDDQARAHLVRAYAHVGEEEAARQVAATFDTRRLLAGGVVLEPPLFQGSVGSSFRVVQQLVEIGALDDRLDASAQESVEGQTRERLGVDLSHEVAGTALLALLDPASVPSAERSQVMGRALAEEHLLTGPLTLEQALSWSALAEYGVAMGVDVDFLGLSDQALAAWTAEDESTVAVSLVRFLLALDATGHLADEPGVPVLMPQLNRLFAEHPPEELSSLELFGGALAVRAVTGRWPLSADVLAAELSQREGDCLGGFTGYVRDARASDSECNVDSTRYARLVERALTAG